MAGVDKFAHSEETLKNLSKKLNLDDLTLISYNRQSLDELSKDVIMKLLIEKDRGGASEIMFNVFSVRHRVYVIRSDDKDEIWIYKNGIYVPEGITYIIEFCRKMLKSHYTTHLKNLLLEKVKAENYVDAETFFDFHADVNLIPVQNGLLDINTKELLPFNPEKIFFSKLPMNFNPVAKSVKILKFIEDICGDQSDVKTIIQFIGTCLLRDNRFEKMLMCIGGGRNGKTKLAELIKCFLGDKNVCGLQPSTFENPESFQTYLLHGKLVNMYMDISKSSFKNTSLLKSLSGRDTISVPRKYKTPLTFKNSCKFIFGANDLPMSYDISSGFWQRWLLITLPYTFWYDHQIEAVPDNEKHKYKTRIDDIIEKITTADELEGLLNLALKGLDDVLGGNSYSYKYTSEEVQTLWVRESDSFAAFFMDCCEIKYDHRIKKQELKKAYSKYCRDHKLKLLGDKRIKAHLEENGCFDERVTSMGEDFYVWDNIGFKDTYCLRTDIDGSDYFKTPTQKEKIRNYISKQKNPPLQDLKMRFGGEVIEDLLSKGDLTLIKGDRVVISS